MVYKLYKIKEVADIVGVTPKTVYRWIESGNLPAIKIVGTWRITQTDLDIFLKNGVV